MIVTTKAMYIQQLQPSLHRERQGKIPLPSVGTLRIEEVKQILRSAAEIPLATAIG